MFACVDVQYSDAESVAGCVVFEHWSDASPAREIIHTGPAPAEYKPGEFYLRELPSILAVVEKIGAKPSLVIVDGYVWLAPSKMGLGAYVHEALGIPVIGVAKRAFQGATPVEVFRGGSRRPLLVTAAGMAVMTAAQHIKKMHGPYRLPTLLKRADRLCRDAMGVGGVKG